MGSKNARCDNADQGSSLNGSMAMTALRPSDWRRRAAMQVVSAVVTGECLLLSLGVQLTRASRRASPLDPTSVPRWHLKLAKLRGHRAVFDSSAETPCRSPRRCGQRTSRQSRSGAWGLLRSARRAARTHDQPVLSGGQAVLQEVARGFTRWGSDLALVGDEVAPRARDVAR